MLNSTYIKPEKENETDDDAPTNQRNGPQSQRWVAVASDWQLGSEYRYR